MKRKLSLIAALAGAVFASQAHAKDLALDVFHNPDPQGFQVASVLIEGEKEAILLDAQFTIPDAQKLVEKVRVSGRELKTVFITQGDPDYYFGLEVIKQAFPKARIVTTSEILKHMEKTADGKMKTWGPQLGPAAPKTIVYPTAYTSNQLMLEGKKIEIKHGVGTVKDQIYMYIPSQKAVVGGVLISGDIHVWTADTQKLAERQDWIKTLNQMIALKPTTVIPGHYQPGAPMTVQSIVFTRDYLTKYNVALSQSKTSGELVQKMTQFYPNAGARMGLELSAKVNTGEMKW